MILFPVSVRYDQEKGKNKKTPAVPRGVSWLDYKASAAELASAKNIGAVIPEGRVVLDLDTYKGVSREAVDSALGCKLDWDEALLQSTVSGGEHYCFALPEGVSVRQGDNLLGVAGFDSRAAGRGWICTGEGYTDESFLMGMPDALYSMPVPMLPPKAVAKLAEGVVWDTPHGDGDSMDDLADLEAAIQERTDEDVTLDIARAYLARLPQDAVEHYSSWVEVGMALHHQFRGSDDALALWLEASARSEKFDEAGCRTRWKSFSTSRRGGAVVTFEKVKRLVGDAGEGDVVAESLCETLIAAASAVDSLQAYEALKAKLLRMSIRELPADHRELVGNALYKAYGKGAGLTRATIRKQLAPKKGARVSQELEGDAPRDVPDWVQDWVYCQATTSFANVAQGRHIKREAFNAAFDREAECMNNFENPVRAADYALINARIPTVADVMYWPGAERFFEAEDGSTMINSYYPSGVAAVPADEQGDEEQAAVARFLQHIDLLVSDAQERQVVLDWMSYVYQHPDEKLTWALLIQGAEGVGKSYLGSLMQLLLGRNARTIDAGAITGRFNGWAHGSVLVTIEEIKISGENKYDIIDRLKPIISNETVSIEEKGRDIRMVPNFTNYLLFTNHKDALPLGDEDRRYAVIFSRFQSAEQLVAHFGSVGAVQDYFDTLFTDLREHAGAIGGHLLARTQHASFAPKGRAPITASKARMQRFSVSEADDFIDAALEDGCPVICERYIDLTWLVALATIDGVAAPSDRALTAALRAKGYEPIPSRRVRITKGLPTPKYHSIWHAPGVCEEEVKRELREFFENRKGHQSEPDAPQDDFDLAPF